MMKLMILPLLVLGMVHAQPAPITEPLLREDWGAVLRAVDTRNSGVPDTVRELVRGQALLATNQNNESFCSFFAASDVEHLATWENWTGQLGALHPSNVVARYLRVDALT